MRSNRITLRGASAMFTVLALAPAPAFAQSAAPEALEEVVVTAEKRETNLQDTPVAVTAVTGETLRVDGGSSLCLSSPLGRKIQRAQRNNAAYDGFHRATFPKILQRDA